MGHLLNLAVSLSPEAETCIAFIIYSGEAGTIYFMFSAEGLPVTQIWIGSKTQYLTLRVLSLGERCYFVKLRRKQCYGNVKFQVFSLRTAILSFLTS